MVTKCWFGQNGGLVLLKTFLCKKKGSVVKQRTKKYNNENWNLLIPLLTPLRL